jgi:hypothetical protein
MREESEAGAPIPSPARVREDASPSEQAASAKAPGFVVLELANLPEHALIDEKALARAFGCADRTIQAMVARYDLPPALDIAGRKLWIVGRLLAWLIDRADRLAQDAERRAEKLRVRG